MLNCFFKPIIICTIPQTFTRLDRKLTDDMLRRTDGKLALDTTILRGFNNFTKLDPRQCRARHSSSSSRV